MITARQKKEKKLRCRRCRRRWSLCSSQELRNKWRSVNLHLWSGHVVFAGEFLQIRQWLDTHLHRYVDETLWIFGCIEKLTNYRSIGWWRYVSHFKPVFALTDPSAKKTVLIEFKYQHKKILQDWPAVWLSHWAPFLASHSLKNTQKHARHDVFPHLLPVT